MALLVNRISIDLTKKYDEDFHFSIHLNYLFLNLFFLKNFEVYSEINMFAVKKVRNHFTFQGLYWTDCY